MKPNIQINQTTENETTILHVSMNIECPTENIDELERILDHHIEYLIDMDNNQDIVTSISNVTTHEIKANDQTTKLQNLQAVIHDILSTKPTDEELNDNEDLIKLYADIYNLKDALNNNL